MQLYILTNKHIILGVFSSVTEAQTRYTQLFSLAYFPPNVRDVRLQEFKVNDTRHSPAVDCTHLLNTTPVCTIVNYTQYDVDNDYDECVDECDNCGGEDCIRNGECCNDNYSY